MTGHLDKPIRIGDRGYPRRRDVRKNRCTALRNARYVPARELMTARRYCAHIWGCTTRCWCGVAAGKEFYIAIPAGVVPEGCTFMPRPWHNSARGIFARHDARQRTEMYRSRVRCILDETRYGISENLQRRGSASAKKYGFAFLRQRSAYTRALL